MEEDKRIEIIIEKGNQYAQTAFSGVSKIRLIAKFAEVTVGAEVYEGTHVVIIDMPSQRGDRKWMNENVFAFTNMGNAETPSEIAAKAEKLRGIYDEKRGGKDMMCVDSVLFELDNMNARYDVREI